MQFNKFVKSLKNNSDVIIREDVITNSTIIYQEQMCNSSDFYKNFHPLLLMNKDISPNELFPGICKEYTKRGNLDYCEGLLLTLFSGLLIYYRKGTCYVFDISKAPTRTTSDSLSEPDNIFGSRDGFVENYKDNIALIRTRVKCDNLEIKEHFVGKRSKTFVGILSIKDITNDKFIKKLEKTIENIDIDAILTLEDISSYLNTTALFPNYEYKGTPDMAVRSLYDGQCLILVDRIPAVITVPVCSNIFSRMKIDGLHLPVFPLLERAFIMFAFLFATVSLALFTSFASYNNDCLSFLIISTLKITQNGVIFPMYIEILIILGLFELYYFIGFRQSKLTLGSTIVLIGGLIIGDNLIKVGIVGVLLMTFTAISYLSTFLINSNVNFIAACSLNRLFLLLCSLFYGLFGVLLGFCIVLYLTYKKTGSSTPLFYPFLPFDFKGIKKFFMSTSSINDEMRPLPLQQTDKTKRKKLRGVK